MIHLCRRCAFCYSLVVHSAVFIVSDSFWRLEYTEREGERCTSEYPHFFLGTLQPSLADRKGRGVPGASFVFGECTISLFGLPQGNH